METHNASRFSITSECPHCRGKLELEVRDKRGPVQGGVRTSTGEWKRCELSILCVTPAGDKALPFLKKMREHADYLNAAFVVALDTKDNGMANLVNVQDLADVVVFVESKGFIESVLRRAHTSVQTTWCLRLDDDEEISPALLEWLKGRQYLEERAWHIPTMALYPNEKTFLTNEPLYPDIHIRLTTWKYYDKVAEAIHAGQPFLAAMCDKVIYHHKYLVESYQDRIKKAAHYDSLHEGAGTGVHKPFTLPEDCFPNAIVAPVQDGNAYKPNNLHKDPVDWALD